MEINDSTKPFLSVIIPAYNEESRLSSTLNTVDAYLSGLGKSYEIIVVNDGSSDNTQELLKEQLNKTTALRIISYENNCGKGYAVRQGVFASRGDYIMFSDADLSAPIDELPKLLSAIKDGYDVAIGSRAVKGAVIPVRQPLYRELGGKGLNLIIRTLAVPGIRDTQCGFKLFRGEVARKVFAMCFLNGWSFDVEVLYLSKRLGYTIAEIPVKWAHSEGSKLHPFTAGLKVVKDIIRLRLHHYDFGSNSNH